MSDATLPFATLPFAALPLGELALCVGAAVAAVAGALAAACAADGRGAARGTLVSALGVAGLLAFLGADLAALLLLVASSGVAFALALTDEPRRSRLARATTALVGAAAAVLAATTVLRGEILVASDAAAVGRNGLVVFDVALAAAAIAVLTALGVAFAMTREASEAADRPGEGADGRAQREPHP